MVGGATPLSTAHSPAGSGQPAPAPSGFEKWWGGPAFTGNWLGLRDALKTHGLTFGGRYDGAFFGVVDSQRGSRGFWDQQLHLNGKLNIGELVGCKLLEAAVLFGEARWRDDRAAADPNTFVQASFLFNPSAWRSGLQWRLSNLGLQISSKDHLPVHDMLVLRGGWLQPQKEFFQQPLATCFLNNAMATVGGNIPFSGSFSTWGGTLKCRPAGWFYAKGGLFMAYPEATNFRNHGLAFEGFARNPRENGLMAMAEAGWTPQFGPSALPGKYVAGGYYWGNEGPSFNGTRHWGQYGFYWQADQMLFHEPRRCEEEPPAPTRPEPRGAAPRNSRGQSSPFSSDPTWSEQGLGFFSLITFAPKYNNLYPFYFHA
ncbi:MAG: carbohydrate porin, partial [Terrimicrobiaceae bacterium]|nr:carbohydrate porin [Terrimicrobiaceae bacterium]